MSVVAPDAALRSMSAQQDAVSSVQPDRHAIALAAFLDQVAGVLRGGLPQQLWIEATVADVRASASGHTLELADAAAGQASATLRVFLPAASLAVIRRDLGVALEPALLVGMTTCLLIAPSFTRRWHLGGRVEGLSRDAAASLRSRLRERIITALKQEKIWDRQHALRRPRDVTRIAIIHPAGAAGWGDIAGELERWERAGLVLVRSCPIAFEGAQAASAIAGALRMTAKPLGGHSPDLVLIVRGGGAKTSLAALDEEAVARAILACPVPVLTGTGHAQDQGTLADRVSAMVADTPSKALGQVSEIMRATRRAAVADLDVIRSITKTTLLTEAGRLEARWQAFGAVVNRAYAAEERRFGDLWLTVRSELSAVAERLKAEGATLDRDLGAVLLRAPQLLDAGDQAIQQLLRVLVGRADLLVAHSDNGDPLLADATARAFAALERETTLLQRLSDTIDFAIPRLLEREAAALQHVAASADIADPERLLPLGYVIVTDERGRLLPSRASAASHTRLRLRFGDGDLAVRPIAGRGRFDSDPTGKNRENQDDDD